MRGQVHKIHPTKASRNGNLFKRIEFILDGGQWAKTDVCPDFANYQRWKSVIKSGVGTMLKDLSWKNEKAHQINADSKITLLVWKGGENDDEK